MIKTKYIILSISLLTLFSCGQSDSLSSFSKRKYLKRSPKQKIEKQIAIAVTEKETYAASKLIFEDYILEEIPEIDNEVLNLDKTSINTTRLESTKEPTQKIKSKKSQTQKKEIISIEQYAKENKSYDHVYLMSVISLCIGLIIGGIIAVSFLVPGLTILIVGMFIFPTWYQLENGWKFWDSWWGLTIKYILYMAAAILIGAAIGAILYFIHVGLKA